MLPNFVIAGTMKAGTTSIWHGLRQHPDVFMPEQKELNFFDSSSGNYGKGIKWYEQQFSERDGESAVGEASPRYMAFEEVPRRIYDVNPDVRLIFVLRDPVDRAYSHYWHMVRNGTETLPFEAAIEREPERIQRNGHDFRAYSYVTRGYYAEQLSRFTESFDWNQLYVAFFEDFLADKGAFYGDLFEFLDVDPSFRPSDRHKNQGGKVRSLFLSRLLYDETPVKRLAGAVLPKQVAATVRDRLFELNTVQGDYPPMGPGVRRQLYEEYATDMERLEEMLGTDLPWEPEPESESEPGP